jgi:glycosyltransferase EpsE
MKLNYSIFIPCYNASKTVLETLENLELSIVEYNKKIDIFIYDDCSTDDTLEIIKQFIPEKSNYHLIQNKINIGERATTNLAFEQMLIKYDWSLMIHADDIPKRKWITDTVKAIESIDQTHFFTVWSSYDSFYSGDENITLGDEQGDDVINKRQKSDAINNIVKIYTSWKISGAAFNLKAFKKINGFDESMAQFGDTDFFSRGILSEFSDVYIRKSLTRYRQSLSSVTSTSYRTNRDIKEIFYLMKKYDNLLGLINKRQMFKKVRLLITKRFIKNIIKFRLNGAKENLFHLLLAYKTK